MGERILVTGASGYVGSNIVDLLLSLGYFVRGTSRSEKPWLNEIFDSKYGVGKFDLLKVPALDDVEALISAMDGVGGVVHVASDLTFSADPKKVIPPVVAATEAVLEAASRVSSVKRVVLTSSSAAAATPKRGEGTLVLTQDTWNDTSIKAAWDETTPAEIKPLVVYAASKAEGERAAFDWVKRNNPGFVFNSVLPDHTIGEVIHPNSASTSSLPARLLEGNDGPMTSTVAQYFVDVKDIARLHAIALFDANVQSERLFGLAFPYTWQDVIHTLRELRPNNEKLATNVPPPRTGFVKLVVSHDRSRELLNSFFGQSDWTSLKDSLDAGITSLGL